MGVALNNVIFDIINNSDLKDIYADTIDGESAYEIIKKRNNEQKEILKQDNLKMDKQNNKKTRSSKVVDQTINSAASTIGRKIGNQIFKGLFK